MVASRLQHVRLTRSGRRGLMSQRIACSSSDFAQFVPGGLGCGQAGAACGSSRFPLRTRCCCLLHPRRLVLHFRRLRYLADGTTMLSGGRCSRRRALLHNGPFATLSRRALSVLVWPATSTSESLKLSAECSASCTSPWPRWFTECSSSCTSPWQRWFLPLFNRYLQPLEGIKRLSITDGRRYLMYSTSLAAGAGVS